MVKRKKILLIAYAFPPLNNPQSIRWFYITKELIKAGYYIDVITIRMPKKFEELLDELPDSVNVYRTFPGPFHALIYSLSIESSRSLKTDQGLIKKLTMRLFNIHKLIYKVFSFLLLPDVQIEWLPFALIKSLSLCLRTTYSCIISSSEPRTSHIVALILKKLTSIPWLAENGDPWIYPKDIHRQLSSKKLLLRHIEQTYLKSVNALTVATEGIKEHYIKSYSMNNIEIAVISQGYDPEIFSAINGTKKNPVFTIVFTGSMYKGLREPDVFFEALKAVHIDDMEVLIAGRINEYSDKIASLRDNRIKYIGYLSYMDSLRLQKQASILLNIGNATEVQLPGKIYEYIGAKKPILHIKTNEVDYSEEIINASKAGIVVNNKVEDIRDVIYKFYHIFKNNEERNHFILEDRREFTWESRVGRLDSILQGLICSRQYRGNRWL
ncbi:group 1 glycosyl transferase [Candidatus Magnetoovum chiemensis]|nr:group 1 glycosyl transferase [Candidatus Magnetoovum chiemensis]